MFQCLTRCVKIKNLFTGILVEGILEDKFLCEIRNKATEIKERGNTELKLIMIMKLFMKQYN